MKTKLGGKAKMLMLTCQTFDTCKDRRAGINKALAGLDIKLADEQEGYPGRQGPADRRRDADRASRRPGLHRRER